MGHRLDVAGEVRELGYLKTFGAPETMRKMPILIEVAMGEEKAVKTMKDMMLIQTHHCISFAQQPDVYINHFQNIYIILLFFQ